MNTELKLLYNQLDELKPYKLQIEDLEMKVRVFKYNCKHEEGIVLKEGTQFDGYDRNEYFALIYCPNCDERFEVFDPRFTERFKIVDGITRLNVRE